MFQIMVANGQSETPIGTVCLTFEGADFMFKENFIVIEKEQRYFRNPTRSINFSAIINATETRT